MNPDRIVKFAGFSVVSDERGNRSYNLHTSNHAKYSVWAEMPEDVESPGKSVQFFWFRMPENTTKPLAVQFLLNKENVSFPEEVKAFLLSLQGEWQPKEKRPRGRPVGSTKKDKPVKVTIEVAPKRLTDDEAAKIKAAGLARIREAAAKRKAAA